MARIAVIGSFVMDNVARMQKFPAAGETVSGESIARFPGGKGANQCVAAARLGGDAIMCGMLGRDSDGEAFREILRAEGISDEYVFSCDLPTAVAQVQVDGSGQNRICVIPSANYAFGQREIERIDGVLKGAELAVFQFELRPEVTRELIVRAKSYGTKVLLNPAPAAKPERELFGGVDYLTPNERELSALTGLPTETEEEVTAAAKALLACGVGAVVATLGARGALVADKHGCEMIAGCAVKAVDTVAAGDSFNGALAVALSEGRTLREAVRFANATGALTVQRAGAIPSLPRREEVEAFIAARS